MVDMGLLHRATVDDEGAARVELLLTSGWCPFASTVLGEVARAVEAMPGVTSADVEIVWTEAWSTARLAPPRGRSCASCRRRPARATRRHTATGTGRRPHPNPARH